MRPLIALALLLYPTLAQGQLEHLLRAAGSTDQPHYAADHPRIRPTLAIRKRGDALLVTYAVLNVTDASLRFVYPDGQQYEFALSDEGRELWRWSADKAFTQAVWEESLAPGASLVVEEPLPWPTGHTVLDLQAHLTVAPWESKAGDVTQEETRISMRLFYGTDDGDESEEAITRARQSDFDGSGTVDFEDFAAFTAAFGTRRGDSRFKPECDLDRDGQIGFSDFFLFASSFGIILPAP